MLLGLLLGLQVVSSAAQFNVTQLEEMHALRFEEIGKLKLIKSYKALKFQINIKTFTESILNATEHFQLVKDMFSNDSYTQCKLDNIKMVLDLKKMEFEDTMYGLLKTDRNEHSRMKRFLENFGLMTSSHGEQIKIDLNAHREKTNEIVKIANQLGLVANKTTTLLNNTVQDMARKTAMMYLLDEKDDIERIVNAITKMLTERRLKSEIIPINELYDAINAMKIDEDEDRPYEKLIDYYYNLRINYTIEPDFIDIEVNVPIVEKAPRKLFKIVEIPARSDGKLIMTDVIWKYIAENHNETVVFMTMDVCYRSQHNEITYYCKTQSPIKNKNSSDCLNDALVGSRKIDINLCKYSAAKPTSLMFIKLNEGEYFYYTPVNETLTITCGAETTNELLVESTSGIINLEPECIAVTSAYKLITTMRYGPTGYRTINVVRVFFDVDKLKDNIKKYNAPYVDNFYIESLGLLRDMSKPIKHIEKLDPNLSVIKSEVLEFMTIIASLIIVIYVLYSVWKFRSNNRKKTQNTSKMPLEEPVDFYVIKE